MTDFSLRVEDSVRLRHEELLDSDSCVFSSSVCHSTPSVDNHFTRDTSGLII